MSNFFSGRPIKAMDEIISFDDANRLLEELGSDQEVHVSYKEWLRREKKKRITPSDAVNRLGWKFENLSGRYCEIRHQLFGGIDEKHYIELRTGPVSNVAIEDDVEGWLKEKPDKIVVFEYSIPWLE